MFARWRRVTWHPRQASRPALNRASIGLSTRSPYMLSVRPILTLFSFLLSSFSGLQSCILVSSVLELAFYY